MARETSGDAPPGAVELSIFPWEPLCGIPEWVAGHGPDLFDLFERQVAELRDDRLGNCLSQRFGGATPELLLAVVRRAIDVCGVSPDELPDELPDDSTSVSFYELYADARQPIRERGRLQPAITWGHSKDHRPDLKQLLFTLTLSDDGGVPLCFHVDCGDTNDDTTHRRSWELLAQLAGTPEFLDVADSKLASRENLRHIAARGGRFLTVLPAT